MELYFNSFSDAFALLVGGDPRVWPVIALSLLVSGTAIGIATLVGIPAGYALGMSRFSGKAFLMIVVNTAMAFPPVVIGLFVYMALSRSGPLGFMELLFTPQGMIIAQVILATPLVTGVSAAAVASVPRDLRLQLRALGASGLQEGFAVLKESRRGVTASVIAGFGAIISEVGAVSIVGGGIEGYTDVMTTAIMANVRRGEFPQAMAWAVILIGIALMVNVALTTMQNTGATYER
ncbi:MAG: ABC transporter permease [Coriobacteriia bacterium]|nr:ABC transporter permease [Coriobacteriia bacterium]